MAENILKMLPHSAYMLKPSWFNPTAWTCSMRCGHAAKTWEGNGCVEERDNGGRNVVVANRIFCPLIISLGHFLQFSGKIATSLTATAACFTTRFNRVSTFRFPIQRCSNPQLYFCSHWLRNWFRVFACINTSKYVITRRSLPNQSMSLFVRCIPRLNSAGLLVRVCGSFRTLSLSMRLSGLVRKWTQKYKQKHSCISLRYSFQQSHYFERFGRIQN